MVGCLPYDHQTVFGVPFKLVWFYYAQRRAGTPAFQSAAASRQLSTTPTGDGLEYQHDFRTISTTISTVASYRR
ncbi:MAG: hypothetical protein LBQ66_15730 [Planctomycetaceae bacterium]|nr:hypothetical protein [Planctomycetaceae bacterium]